MADALEAFRAETHEWIKENFPASLKGSSMGLEGEADEAAKADFELYTCINCSSNSYPIAKANSARETSKIRAILRKLPNI